MKIRDLLVILFTAIVALLVLGRAARADGICPTNGAGGDCPGGSSSTGGDLEASFPVQLVDWMCADSCASICRDRCVAACADSLNPHCLQACYPVCANECYTDCFGTEPAETERLDSGIDPTRLLLDTGGQDAGAP